MRVCLYSWEVDFRHIAIEGPTAVGKGALAERLAARLDTPDFVIHLQTPTDLLSKRARAQGGGDRADPEPDDPCLGEPNEACNHFFFDSTTTPLLLVEMSESDLCRGKRTLDEPLKQIESMGSRTRYYLPRTAL